LICAYWPTFAGWPTEMFIGPCAEQCFDGSCKVTEPGCRARLAGGIRHRRPKRCRQQRDRPGSRVLRLTLLAPPIVAATLNSRQEEGLTLPRLMHPFPVKWDGQHFHPSASLTATLEPAPCARAD
jgi:hypothetical protein